MNRLPQIAMRCLFASVVAFLFALVIITLLTHGRSKDEVLTICIVIANGIAVISVYSPNTFSWVTHPIIAYFARKRILDLKKLFDAGILTEEEYQQRILPLKEKL